MTDRLDVVQDPSMVIHLSIQMKSIHPACQDDYIEWIKRIFSFK